ncbi:toxin [Pseudomonas capsici]|uniref:Toxin n=1 Tax=Pseudomonas capsici TaxID=2810614 RepID=A0ABT3BTG9_9PSED|nr:SpvB/TcaC N-terminal domain-containing protein [Pseudomonas capsici]MBN6713137.1 toxin [Pseudomonas capsici]MBN6718129.1 toxin [Pseudomonas capsici]MBN6722587.1 toxin [Pseudomonas capsici]MCV4266766.1 toxin [Pseudomonas capsici]MCV4277643.1 toxin [Pseudomonas capsici]
MDAQESSLQTSQPAVITPSLPKGGGAIQSIGKGWGAVGSNGTASLEIPLPVSPGRGYEPALSLNYQSSIGNGLFGLGWNLNIGCVARRASKGVPTYTDEDVILGPNGEVWLPERDADGTIRFTRVSSYNGHDLGVTYQVVRYFARLEGAFERIEHWRIDTVDPGFWLIHDADGNLYFYGKKASSRSTDPADSNRVAEWLLEESMNPLGEHILYEYKAEDEVGLPEDHPRDFIAQCYLWRVRYGNAQAHPVLYLWDEDSLENLQWHFDLLFDYGERSTDPKEKPTYAEQVAWPVRSDPHSSFAYGFELGNLRLCQQVLMFHHFPDELEESPLLVQRLLLEYQQTSLKYNLLSAAHAQAWDGTTSRQLQQQPAMQFSYSQFNTENDIYTPLDPMPGLNDGQNYQMIDLYGDGLPGVLYQSDKSWFYREPVHAESGEPDTVTYAPARELPEIPATDSSKPVNQTLLDLTGDGRLNWLIAQPGMAGFLTINPDRSWSGFTPFQSFPVEFQHPRGQLADLTGDGLSDLALIGPHSARLYANRRTIGFSVPMDVPHDDDRLPVFSDSPNELVVFNDLLGTGQQHLIRIRHNEARFWPNMGGGRFGTGKLFASLPFDYDTFDAQRIRLADLDGSGASDLLYLEPEGIRIFMNEGGNAFAEPFEQAWPEGMLYDRFCQVSAVDLQGLGFSSLVLTAPHMEPRHWTLHYAANRAGLLHKPYLLNATDNHMGATGEVTYRSSAQEWLDEKKALQDAGKTPVSFMPFPLHVVVRQTRKDIVTGTTLTQLFNYRQGFYDPQEREFRGFGLVLQTDTEKPPQQQEGFTAGVLNKTWFHNGRTAIPTGDDYDTSDPQAIPLGEHLLSGYDPDTHTDHLITDPDEATRQEMARALSGSPLRTEIFGLDENQQPDVLYSVQAYRYLVRQLQPLNAHQPYALMLPLELESITWQYEAEQLDDPMCQHSLNLAWDLYGTLTHSVVVNYARRKKPGDTPPFEDPYQQQWWQASHDEAQQYFYLNEMRSESIHLDDPQSWRLGLPYRGRSNAMVVPASALSPSQISHERFIDPQGTFASLPRTLTALSVQRYIGCSDGEATFQALTDATESAELDDHALSAYDRVMDSAQLTARLIEVGYQQMPSFLPDDGLNLWSVKRGFATYAGPEGFYRIMTFRPTRSHGWSSVEYDPYYLFVAKVTDPVGCSTTASYNYRALQVFRIVDPNRNTQEADYDGFGRLWATSFYGTELGQPVGFDPLNPDKRFWGGSNAAVNAPANALANSASVYYYDGNLIMDPGTIPFACATLQADRYPGDPEKQIRISLVSLDGFGRTLQTRQLVEDGDAYAVDANGYLELENGKPKIVHASPRWRVSERVEYNNKGLAVRIYRPYFANSHVYIKDERLREHGHYDRQFYDALGRPTITLTAKGWMRRQTYRTWYTISEDENDTAEEMLALKAAGEQE